MNRSLRLFEDTVIKLYLVEVLLNIVDVLLHFISILLQLLDQRTQFGGGSAGRQTQRDEEIYCVLQP